MNITERITALFLSFIKKSVVQDEILRITLPRADSDASLKLLSSDMLVASPKSVYTIFTSHSLRVVHGMIDMSDARDGDNFVIRLVIRMNDKYVVSDAWTITGEQSQPLFVINGRLMTPDSRVEISQTTGLSKRIWFNFYG